MNKVDVKYIHCAARYVQYCSLIFSSRCRNATFYSRGISSLKFKLPIRIIAVQRPLETPFEELYFPPVSQTDYIHTSFCRRNPLNSFAYSSFIGHVYLKYVQLYVLSHAIMNLDSFPLESLPLAFKNALK